MRERCTTTSFFLARESATCNGRASERWGVVVTPSTNTVSASSPLELWNESTLTRVAHDRLTVNVVDTD